MPRLSRLAGWGLPAFLLLQNLKQASKRRAAISIVVAAIFMASPKGNGTYNGFLDTPVFVDIWDVVYERDERGALIKKDCKPIIIEKIGAAEALLVDRTS